MLLNIGSTGLQNSKPGASISIPRTSYMPHPDVFAPAKGLPSGGLTSTPTIWVKTLLLAESPFAEALFLLDLGGDELGTAAVGDPAKPG